MRLGWGATLTELTREYSHPFGLDVAHSLDDVLAEPERLPQWVLPVAAALPRWSAFRVDAHVAAGLRNGIPAAHRPEFGAFVAGERAVLHGADGEPLALAEARELDGRPVWAVLRGLFTPSTP